MLKRKEFGEEGGLVGTQGEDDGVRRGFWLEGKAGSEGEDGQGEHVEDHVSPPGIGGAGRDGSRMEIVLEGAKDPLDAISKPVEPDDAGGSDVGIEGDEVVGFGICFVSLW